MPDAWTADDLLFALVRAEHLEPPRRVADRLLSAADQPGTCLSGVTPLQARLQAAQVLIEAGLRDDAIAVVRQAVQAAGHDADGSARMTAAPVLADAGAADEAAALAIAAVRERPGSEYQLFGHLLELSVSLVGDGHLAQATRIADEMAASAASMPGSDGRFHLDAAVRAVNARAGELKAKIVTIAEMAREELMEIRRQAEGEGADPVEAAARRRLAVRRDAAAEIDAQRPWPALVDDRLLWWPRAEYGRLVGQVPEVADILGSTWREHTARVESFLAAAAPATAGAAATTPGTGAAQMLLAHADFARFVAYLQNTGASPRLSTVQTAFTRHAGAGYAYPARWPPGRRFPCWCGSPKKYQRCCGALVSKGNGRR
ncbi:MAG TPA: SEC-C domain-containing protein [Streptosporangiaceae bacterium]|nr:SEC-C domain-containing protein [Streptosporangiaceae bacterium]